MEFSSTQPIYLQIVNWVLEQILSENWKAGEKVMSVRELAVHFEVNANTVMRSYDYLQNNQILMNKRGIGFFVAENAVEIIRTLRKKQFMDEEVPVFFKHLRLLDIDIKEIINLYNVNSVKTPEINEQ
ncbi:MAG: GntR family transcriptional regulator [Bacteroidales bacterium]|nr:GntR family transcriptional regulator [Bacteroidales bacterium]